MRSHAQVSWWSCSRRDPVLWNVQLFDLGQGAFCLSFRVLSSRNSISCRRLILRLNELRYILNSSWDKVTAEYLMFKIHDNPNHHSDNNSNSINDTEGQIAMSPNAHAQNASQPQHLAFFPAHFPSPAGCHVLVQASAC